MKKKKKVIITILFSFLLFLFYFFLFPYKTEKEICVKPTRTYNLEQILRTMEKPESINTTPSEDETFYFRSGDIFGYLDKNAHLVYAEHVLYNVALSDKGYINYSSIQDVHQSLVLMDTSGNYVQSFSIPGYPFFSNNGKRLFIIKTDATGIREVTPEGEELWQVEFASIITSFAANDEYALVGLVNGMIKVYTKAGECIYNFKPQGGRLSVVYSASLSDDGKTMAVISGLDPQHLFFFKRGNTNYHNPIKKVIGDELRRPAFTGYTQNDKYILFESSRSLFSMDLHSLKIAQFPVEGRLSHVDTHATSQYFAAALQDGQSGSQTDIYIGKPGNLIFLKYSSAGSIGYLRFLHNFLITGTGNHLIILDIGEA